MSYFPSLKASLIDYDGKPTSLTWIYSIPSNPINLNVTPEPEKKVELVITTKGGSLKATGSDGTSFTLEIPPNALLNKTKITMIPSIKVEGMPFGESPFSVQLEPSGLQLMKPAILTIQTPVEIPISNQLFLGFEKTGQNLFVAPPVVKSKSIQIQVVHFSGYMVTKGYAADLESTRMRLGGSVEDKLNSLVSEKLIRERMRQLLGSEEPSDVLTDLGNGFKEYYEKVLKQRLEAAAKPGASCAVGRLAQQSALSLSRAAAIAGYVEYAEEFAIFTNINKVDLQCMKEEFELCRDKHYVHRMLPLWFGNIKRHIVLTGKEDPEEEALELVYVEKCLRFDLEFESTVTSLKSDPLFTSAVSSRVSFRLDKATLKIKGNSPLDNTSFVVTPKNKECKIKSATGGGNYQIFDMIITADTNSLEDELGFTKDLRLAHLPGLTAESFTMTCPNEPPYSTIPTFNAWTGIFTTAHFKDMIFIPDDEGLVGLVFKDWDIKYDELFAEKKWKLSVPPKGKKPDFTEEGSALIFHHPARE